MKRRKFMALLGGAAAAWPVAAHEQQPMRKRVGILSPEAPPPGLLREFEQEGG
jgi:hypothetical protein